MATNYQKWDSYDVLSALATVDKVDTNTHIQSDIQHILSSTNEKLSTATKIDAMISKNAVSALKAKRGKAKIKDMQSLSKESGVAESTELSTSALFQELVNRVLEISKAFSLEDRNIHTLSFKRLVQLADIHKSKRKIQAGYVGGMVAMISDDLDKLLAAMLRQSLYRTTNQLISDGNFAAAVDVSNHLLNQVKNMSTEDPRLIFLETAIWIMRSAAFMGLGCPYLARLNCAQACHLSPHYPGVSSLKAWLERAELTHAIAQQAQSEAQLLEGEILNALRSIGITVSQNSPRFVFSITSGDKKKMNYTDFSIADENVLSHLLQARTLDNLLHQNVNDARICYSDNCPLIFIAITEAFGKDNVDFHQRSCIMHAARRVFYEAQTTFLESLFRISDIKYCAAAFLAETAVHLENMRTDPSSNSSSGTNSLSNQLPPQYCSYVMYCHRLRVISLVNAALSRKRRNFSTEISPNGIDTQNNAGGISTFMLMGLSPVDLLNRAIATFSSCHDPSGPYMITIIDELHLRYRALDFLIEAQRFDDSAKQLNQISQKLEELRSLSDLQGVRDDISDRICTTAFLIYDRFDSSTGKAHILNPPLPLQTILNSSSNSLTVGMSISGFLQTCCELSSNYESKLNYKIATYGDG